METAYAVLYCHLCPVWFYHIFPYYLIKGTIFGKSFEYKTCVLIFSTTDIFLILRRIHQDIVTIYIVLRVKCPLFLPFLIKLDFSRQIFVKKSNIKFHENLSSWSRVAPCGRTGRYKEANIRFSQNRKST